MKGQLTKRLTGDAVMTAETADKAVTTAIAVMAADKSVCFQCGYNR
jgi:hypothetical protein